jgi:hypothetical protein
VERHGADLGRHAAEDGDGTVVDAERVRTRAGALRLAEDLGMLP